MTRRSAVSQHASLRRLGLHFVPLPLRFLALLALQIYGALFSLPPARSKAHSDDKVENSWHMAQVEINFCGEITMTELVGTNSKVDSCSCDCGVARSSKFFVFGQVSSISFLALTQAAEARVDADMTR